MTLRPTTDPGVATRTAKNENATPGLPNNSRNDSKGRSPMVGTARARLSEAAHRLVQQLTGGRLVYTPQALNRLIDTAVVWEVAARLRRRASYHVAQAHNPELTVFERQWHAEESIQLDEIADRELAMAERGER